MRCSLPCLLGVFLPLTAHAAAPDDRAVHRFVEVAISPDGQSVASVEGDLVSGGSQPPVQHLVLRRSDGRGSPVTVALPCGDAPQCWPSSLAWSHDGKRLAFALRAPGTHTDALYAVGSNGTGLTRLLAFNGTLTGLRFGPRDDLAALAVAAADKEVGATQAGAPIVGALGTTALEQRIGVLEGGALRFASPADMFVYQYSWRPDGSGFVGTAAHGDGDNNYWVAGLYGFDRAGGQATELFRPGPREQLADPVVSPDGGTVAFIGGIMSDFGAVGGDVFLLRRAGGAAPVDITPGLKASAVSLGWSCRDGALAATLLHDERQEVVSWGRNPSTAAPRVVWSGAAVIEANDFDGWSEACAAPQTATTRQDWITAPEIALGPLGHWRDLTHVNAGLTVPASVRNVTWSNEGHHVQGWLLLPAAKVGGSPGGRLPMITVVHGGPASASTPRFLDTIEYRDLIAHGYAMFFPNPRGSFGQGEAFTLGNVRDIGGGDLRDIMAGIDATIRAAPIDGARLGITGGSYGGFMTMWAVTQTNRFRAGVAVAGLSDWLSYYGENGIDGWMTPYFGGTVYADPAIYARSSPIDFITHVRTPTAAYAGQYDIECPPGQTQEFWHALDTLGVPTEAVIYPGEGHGLRDPRNVADEQRRQLAWFDRFIGDHRTSRAE